MVNNFPCYFSNVAISASMASGVVDGSNPRYDAEGFRSFRRHAFGCEIL